MNIVSIDGCLSVPADATSDALPSAVNTRLIVPNNTSVILTANGSLLYTNVCSSVTNTYVGTGTINSTVRISACSSPSTYTATGIYSTSCCAIGSSYLNYVTSGNMLCTPDGLQQLQKYKKQIVPKRTKASIKRALKLMFNMGFEEEAKIFLKGESIEISHPDSVFKFVITKYKDSIIHRTEYPGYSTPYKLELYTKSDVFIAKLCIYMEDTPMLDQVLGVALFIKSGDESRILKQANWFTLSDDKELRQQLALRHPELSTKLKIKIGQSYDEPCNPSDNQVSRRENSQRSGFTVDSISGEVLTNSAYITA